MSQKPYRAQNILATSEAAEFAGKISIQASSYEGFAFYAVSEIKGKRVDGSVDLKKAVELARKMAGQTAVAATGEVAAKVAKPVTNALSFSALVLGTASTMLGSKLSGQAYAAPAREAKPTREVEVREWPETTQFLFGGMTKCKVEGVLGVAIVEKLADEKGNLYIIAYKSVTGIEITRRREAGEAVDLAYELTGRTNGGQIKAGAAIVGGAAKHMGREAAIASGNALGALGDLLTRAGNGLR